MRKLSEKLIVSETHYCNQVTTLSLSIHDNKRITMYCLDCTVTTCSKCAVTSHASHNTDIIADIVETERAGVHSTFGGNYYGVL